MHVNDIEGLAMRLRSVIRRAHNFGHSLDDVFMEIDWIVKDLEKHVNQVDRDMEDAYLNSLADYHEYVMEG